MYKHNIQAPTTSAQPDHSNNNYPTKQQLQTRRISWGSPLSSHLGHCG